jgi:hypothetical protein
VTAVETSRASTAELWDELARPIDPWSATEALIGLSSGGAHLLAAILLLSSEEAETLLGKMHDASRALTIGTSGRTERSNGEIRGPILWSETLSARSSGGDDTMVFVYSLPARVYDTPENRVLVGALRVLKEAGRTVNTRALRERDSDLARMLAERSAAAVRWLDHRALSGVPAVRLTARDRQRARSGTRRRTYGPASDLLDRHAVPLTGDDVALVADERTQAQHRGVLWLIRGFRSEGRTLPPLTTHQGLLAGGPLVYVHERSRPGRAERRAGIFLNGRPVDVVTAGGQPVRTTASPSDGDRLLLGSEADVRGVLEAAGC